MRMEQLWFPGYWKLQGWFLFYSPPANLYVVTIRFQLPVTASTIDRHVVSFHHFTVSFFEESEKIAIGLLMSSFGLAGLLTY